MSKRSDPHKNEDSEPLKIVTYEEVSAEMKAIEDMQRKDFIDALKDREIARAKTIQHMLSIFGIIVAISTCVSLFTTLFPLNPPEKGG
jgi:hypothetical protein